MRPLGRVQRPAVEVEVTGWFSRDPPINVLDFRTKARGIELGGARNWHSRESMSQRPIRPMK
jgi:hypothetical protein